MHQTPRPNLEPFEFEFNNEAILAHGTAGEYIMPNDQTFEPGLTRHFQFMQVLLESTLLPNPHLLGRNQAVITHVVYRLDDINIVPLVRYAYGSSFTNENKPESLPVPD